MWKSLRDPHHHPLQFFFFLRAPCILIQHYWERRNKHYGENTPPIQSHYFSFSNTHTHTNNITSSSVENWEKITRRADAGEVFGARWNGKAFENESFSSSAEKSGMSAGFSRFEKRRKTCEVHPSTASHSGTIFLSRPRKKKLSRKKGKKHYQLLYFF
jgi:hypothetical protein